MRTIGRKWPRSAKGDYPATCDYCGVPWRRSLMRRDRAGLLACPDDRRGRDVVTLSEGNARGAAAHHPPVPRNDGNLYVPDEVVALPNPPGTPSAP